MLSKYDHLKTENGRHTTAAAVPTLKLASALYENLKQRYGDVTMEQISPGGVLWEFFFDYPWMAGKNLQRLTNQEQHIGRIWTKK